MNPFNLTSNLIHTNRIRYQNIETKSIQHSFNWVHNWYLHPFDPILGKERVCLIKGHCSIIKITEWSER